MSRGTKSYGRDRCTLHPKHLQGFKEFLRLSGKWQLMAPTGHAYEVLHVSKLEYKGHDVICGESAFIYRNDRNEHLTVQAPLVPFMKQFLKERKTK